MPNFSRPGRGWLSAAGTSGSRPASSPCQPGDDAQPAPSGSLFLSHPQNPSGSQFTIFNQWQTLSIFPPLDRVRFPLRWKYLAYFEQRALPLPSPSHTPGLRHVSSPISVTHPHTQHFSYTVNFILFLLFRSLTHGISTLLCADDLSPPRAAATFPWQPPTIPCPETPFPTFFFFFFPQYILVSSNRSPWLQLRAVAFRSPRWRFEREGLRAVAGSLPGFSRCFQDVHVSSTRGY